jgi:hypothetical protein
VKIAFKRSLGITVSREARPAFNEYAANESRWLQSRPWLYWLFYSYDNGKFYMGKPIDEQSISFV